ncbi:MAG: septum formation initiator family protein [Clostridia bacterium]|nr:septum formation initiator family protein [Clostridia bacterium]
MRAYNANAALDINVQRRQTAAPKHAITPPSTTKHVVATPHLVPQKLVSENTSSAQVRESAKSATKIIVLSVLLLAMFSTLVFERVQLLKLNTEAAKIEQRISDAKSETVRLESEFNSLFSIDSIEKYAEEELGMVKRQKYQVRFFTNDSEDEVVIYDGHINE